MTCKYHDNPCPPCEARGELCPHCLELELEEARTRIAELDELNKHMARRNGSLFTRIAELEKATRKLIEYYELEGGNADEFKRLLSKEEQKPKENEG